MPMNTSPTPHADKLVAAHTAAYAAFYASRAHDNDGREADAEHAARLALIHWPTDRSEIAAMIAATIRNGAQAATRYSTWRDADPDHAA